MTYCCGVCEHFLADLERPHLHGWCQADYPVSAEFVDIDDAGGIGAYRDGGGAGDLRVTERMTCEKFTLLQIKRKAPKQGSD